MATWKHLAIGGGSLALAGGAIWWLRRKSDVEVIGGQSEPSASTSAGVTPQADNVGSAGDPPPVSDQRWGSVPTDVQKLLIKLQSAANIPYLWVAGSIIAQGEASFVPTAHNISEKEVKGSRDGLKNGLARGNAKPKFAAEIEAFGSGGLFGALAPYFAWVGLDEGYMPFLMRRPTLMFEPAASAVFMAHYFWRITAPMYAKNRALTLFDVRIGWASPSVLKNDPFGSVAQQVRGRMRESIKVIGWDEKWVESLPIVRDRYRGIQAVAPAMGYSPAQED